MPAIMTTTVSILLPVLNAEPFLSACLDSVLAQDIPDWELWAVDDHSSDGSPAILSGYAARDHRIRWCHNEGKGIAPALRTAFQRTAGALVTRMDADDLMLPTKLRCLRDALREHPDRRAVAIGKVRYFGDQGLGAGYRRYADWLNGLADGRRHYLEIYRECTIPSPCWMTWRENLSICGAFREDIYPEDYDLAFRFRAAGLQILACPEVLHAWRDHPDRSSRTQDVYADNAFLPLKVSWFLMADYDSDRTLVVWGAGRKGKVVAGLLAARNIAFSWVCDNPRKCGHIIRGVRLQSPESLRNMPRPQVLVTVAARGAADEIGRWMDAGGLSEGRDYFFFC
ncbi:MAG: hypothetical protein RLY31_810 [Bacteroidota bacterium]